MVIDGCLQSSLYTGHCIYEGLPCFGLALDMQLNGEPLHCILDGCKRAYLRAPHRSTGTSFLRLSAFSCPAQLTDASLCLRQDDKEGRRPVGRADRGVCPCPTSFWALLMSWEVIPRNQFSDIRHIHFLDIGSIISKYSSTRK